MIDTSTVATWVDGYVRAWQSNDAADIGVLFTDDAHYYTSPFAEPWAGREAIIQGWTDRQDDPGSTTFRYEIVATTDTTAVVRGWTVYLDQPREYSNIWLVEFAPDGRCQTFTEWWMERGSE